MTNNHHNHNKIINHHHLPSPSSTSTKTTRSTTTVRSNSTTQACASCRYQRRKCAPDCVLAPYFPHDRQRHFQNAHKLFGVSNITKIIRDLDPPQKDEAMRTIIYQSDVRALDPVGGCYRIIRELQRQIEYSRAELEIVLQQLAFCRTHGVHAQNVNQNQNQNCTQNQNDFPHDQIVIDGVDCDIHLVNNPNDQNLYDDNHNLDLDLGQLSQQQEHEHEEYIVGDQNLNDQEINSWANMNMNNSPSSSAVCLEVKLPVVDECEDFKTVLVDEIPAGERHEFKFEFDEINEPSDETLFIEGNHKALTKEENVTFFTKENNIISYQQHNEDHDLKGAATLFTLTNCSTY